MKPFIFIALVLAVQIAHAETDSQKIDAELNSAYKKIVKNMFTDNGDFHRNAFKQSQRDWLKFRNSQCKLTSGMYAPVLSEEEIKDFEICTDTFNTERIKFFNKFIADYRL